MNEIRRIAKIYFKEFEGFHLYTNPRTELFYTWLTSLLAMITINIAFLILFSSNRISEWYSIFPFASDALAAFLFRRITKQRIFRIKEIMKFRDGFEFDSLDSCKRKRLSILLGSRSEKFLEVANDICKMQSILAQHDPVAQEINIQVLIRYVYDDRSKDRIMNLALVVFGVFITLAATGQANLENLFEAFSSDSYWTLITLLEMLAVVGFMVWMMLLILWFSLRYVFSQWRAKLSKELLGGNTEVSYMVCDLVRLHKRPPITIFTA